MLSKLNLKYQYFLLYGFPVLLLLTLSFGFNFNGLYGQDSHAYYQFSKELLLYLEEGKQFGDFYWPKTYSFIGTILSYSSLPILVCLRLISFLSLIGALFYANRIIKMLYHKDGSLFLFLGACLSTYFVRASLFVMSDMLAVFFITLFFYSYISYWKEKRKISIIILFISGILSFSVRYACLPLIVFPIVTVLYDWFKDLNKDKYALVSILIAIAIFFIYSNQDFIQFLMNEFSIRWNYKNIFTKTFVNSDGVLKHWVPNFIYVFGNYLHFGYLSMGILLLPFYRKIDKTNQLVLISVLIYFLFIAGVYSQNYRFIIITHLPVLILLFPAFDKLWCWLDKKKLQILFTIGLLIFNSTFFIYSFGKTYRVHQNEKEIASELIKLNSNQAIYSFYVDQSFPSYGIENEIRNLYLEDYREFEKGSLVVFNEIQLGKQWEETQVMKNWRRLVTNYQIEELITLENNWKIYRIK